MSGDFKHATTHTAWLLSLYTGLGPMLSLQEPTYQLSSQESREEVVAQAGLVLSGVSCLPTEHEWLLIPFSDSLPGAHLGPTSSGL